MLLASIRRTPCRCFSEPTSRSRTPPSSAALLLCSLAIACGNAYPIPPTECDDWCLAIQRAACEEDRPEECVSECEQTSLIRHAPQCASDWNALLECYQAADDRRFSCRARESRPDPELCLDERLTLGYCTSERFGLCSEACLRESLACDASPAQCEAFCLWTSEGCDAEHIAVYRCALEQPVHCGAPDQDPRSPEQMCLSEIDALFTCAEADP